MSSSEGWMVADKLAFPDNATGLDFVFGCENIETGALNTLRARRQQHKQLTMS